MICKEILFVISKVLSNFYSIFFTVVIEVDHRYAKRRRSDRYNVRDKKDMKHDESCIESSEKSGDFDPGDIEFVTQASSTDVSVQSTPQNVVVNVQINNFGRPSSSSSTLSPILNQNISPHSSFLQVCYILITSGLVKWNK